MMSRGTCAVDRERPRRPPRTPARAAGDPGATATTRGADIAPGYGARAPHRSPGSRRRPVPWPAMAVDKVLLAAPRGFCAGVEMAIKALAWMVRAFEPPVYCYHEIVHNQLVVDRFRDLGVVFVDDIAEVPAGSPDHALGPRLGARGGRGGPGQRRLRRRRGVPAGHQGAPRGEGAGRQGLPDRLRRPRGPRGGRRHHGGRARRPSTGWSRSPRSTPCPPSISRWPCSPRPRSRHRDWAGGGRRAPRSASPTSGRPAAATSASPPPTASRRSVRDRRALRRRRRHRLRQLVEHPGARAPGPRGRVRRGASGSTAPTSCPTTCRGTVGVTAGASAPEELVEAVIDRLDPDRRRRGGAHHRRGRVLPAASRAARPADRRRRARHLQPRRLRARPPAAPRPRPRTPATSWPRSSGTGTLTRGSVPWGP